MMWAIVVLVALIEAVVFLAVFAVLISAHRAEVDDLRTDMWRTGDDLADVLKQASRDRTDWAIERNELVAELDHSRRALSVVVGKAGGMTLAEVAEAVE